MRTGSQPGPGLDELGDLGPLLNFPGSCLNSETSRTVNTCKWPGKFSSTGRAMQVMVTTNKQTDRGKTAPAPRAVKGTVCLGVIREDFSEEVTLERRPLGHLGASATVDTELLGL